MNYTIIDYSMNYLNPKISNTLTYRDIWMAHSFADSTKHLTRDFIELDYLKKTYFGEL